MKHSKRIAYENLPQKPPITISCLMWLIMRELNADEFANGIVLTLVVIVWITWIYEICTCDFIDIFEDK